MHHDRLRISLHGRSHGYERHPIAHGFQDIIRGTHGELDGAYGNFLAGVDVGTSGKNPHIQTFVFVEPTNLRVVKAAVLRLRVPVGLQGYRDEPAGGWLLLAAPKHQADAEQAHAGFSPSHHHDCSVASPFWRVAANASSRASAPRAATNCTPPPDAGSATAGIPARLIGVV